MATDTKTALLDSAERAARTRGFDGFSYADLAADVGIRKASIHHHFATKAVLSVALMQRYHLNLQRACADIDATCSSGGARLTAFIQIYRSALKDGKSLCLCVALSTSRESLPQVVISQISQFRAMILSWLQDVFETAQSDGSILNAGSPAAEAAAALALLEGAQLAARAEEAPDLFDRAVCLMRQRLR